MGNRARVAVFISGGGSNLQSLIDASADGSLAADIGWVVSSSRKAYGLKRAAEAGIETYVYRSKDFASPEKAGEDLFARLRDRNIEIIALAGYLKLLPAIIVRNYKGRIVNIHAALLPKHGGPGMYGRHVHEAVIAAGERESGATIHLVDEIYDNGKILEQVRIPVLPNDNADTLAARVLLEEHKLYPMVLDKLIKGMYDQT